MKATIKYKGKKIKVNLYKPLDISMAMRDAKEAASAWYVDKVNISPVRMEGFVGSVAEGSAVNFNDIDFNPHGNGTHTECVGHISKEVYSVNKSLSNYFFMADVVTIKPMKWDGINSDFRKKGDKIIGLEQLKYALGENPNEAVVIRTSPNTEDKLTRQYSNSNPCYVQHEAMEWLVSKGVAHFLIDLPSVDREVDAGLMMAHKAFWQHQINTRFTATITELVYVNNSIKDGSYLLNLQTAAFENDATPSRPVLFEIL